MGKSDALISGSFAVQYFERVLWEESDMDVFVQRGKSAMELGRYLCTVEGYESVRVREADEYMIESIHEVGFLFFFFSFLFSHYQPQFPRSLFNVNLYFIFDQHCYKLLTILYFSSIFM